MSVEHPIDQELRARLRQLFQERGQGAQTEFAQRIGRGQSWLNKYANGAGHATVDDAVRIAAALLGVAAIRLTETEARLLRAFRQIPDREEIRVDAIEVFENHAKLLRQRHGRQSAVPKAHTPAEIKSKAREKR